MPSLMAASNHALVYQGLEALGDGLKPVCEREWAATYGDDWLVEVNEKLPRPLPDPSTDDPAFLLKAIHATWDDVWRRLIRFEARELVWEVRRVRNVVSHRRGGFYNKDADRSLRAIDRLLESFGVEEQRGTVQRYRESVRRKLAKTAEDRERPVTAVQAAERLETGIPHRVRVDACLGALTEGLRRRCAVAWGKEYGKEWRAIVNQKLDSPVRRPDTGDLSFLAPGIVATWDDVWHYKHGREVSDLIKFVHSQERFLNDHVSADESYWLIGAIKQILESFKAEKQLALVEQHREALLRQAREQAPRESPDGFDLSDPPSSGTESVLEAKVDPSDALPETVTTEVAEFRVPTAAPTSPSPSGRPGADLGPAPDAGGDEGSLGLLGAAFRDAGFRADGTRAEVGPEARRDTVPAPEPEPAPAAPVGSPRQIVAPDPRPTPAPVAGAGDMSGIATRAVEPVHEDEPISPYDRPGSWYVIHAYSGYEKKVKARLATRTSSMHMEDRIFEVVIPTEKVVEIKGGRKVEVEKRMFPGYLLIRMYLDDDSWHAVRNTPGVTSFVGMGTGNKPTSLSKREVERFLGLKKEAAKKPPRFRPAWEIGETVRVSSGPFADFNGVVEDINVDRQKVTVLVEIFGRDTPMELGFEEIQKQ